MLYYLDIMERVREVCKKKTLHGNECGTNWPIKLTTVAPTGYCLFGLSVHDN